LFGAEIPGGVSNRNRVIASILGCMLIGGLLLQGRFFAPTPSPTETQIPKPLTPPPNEKSPSLSKPMGADVYIHPSGSFERQGEVWVEYPPYAKDRNFRFKEARRDDQYILIYDETRHKENDPVRVLYLRIPIAGGMLQWSYPNPFEWKDLYPVSPKTK